MVLSLCDGIAGARRGLELIEISAALYASSEIDKAAIRATSTAYPDTIHLGNLEEISEQNIRDLKVRCPRATVGLVSSGFACIDLTRLKAGRQGLEGRNSKLFWGLLRFISALTSRWWPELRWEL